MCNPNRPTVIVIQIFPTICFGNNAHSRSVGLCRGWCFTDTLKSSERGKYCWHVYFYYCISIIKYGIYHWHCWLNCHVTCSTSEHKLSGTAAAGVELTGPMPQLDLGWLDLGNDRPQPRQSLDSTVAAATRGRLPLSLYQSVAFVSKLTSKLTKATTSPSISITSTTRSRYVCCTLYETGAAVPVSVFRHEWANRKSESWKLAVIKLSHWHSTHSHSSINLALCVWHWSSDWRRTGLPYGIVIILSWSLNENWLDIPWKRSRNLGPGKYRNRIKLKRRLVFFISTDQDFFFT